MNELLNNSIGEALPPEHKLNEALNNFSSSFGVCEEACPITEFLETKVPAITPEELIYERRRLHKRVAEISDEKYKLEEELNFLKTELETNFYNYVKALEKKYTFKNI